MNRPLNRITLFIFVCIHSAFTVFANRTSAVSDSLLNALKVSREDTSRVNILNQLSKQCVTNAEYDKALEHAQNAFNLSEKLGFGKGIAMSANNIGNVYWYMGSYDKALENYFQSFSTWEKLGDKQGIAAAYNCIGIAYIMQGSYEKALEVQLKSLKIKEELNDKPGVANTYNSIGVIYWKMGNYDLALNQYQNCLKLWNELGEKKGISAAYNNMGIIYNLKAEFGKALDSYLMALRLAEEMGDKKGIAQAYNNIGSIYVDWGNIFLEEKNTVNASVRFKKALENHMKSLNIRMEIKDKHGEAMSHNNIGGVYVKMNKLEDALVHLEHSLTVFRELGDKDGVKDSYASLSDLYSKKKEHKKAYDFHKLYSDLKDSLLNEESAKQIAEMNVKYDSEKKDKELIKKDAEINKQQAEAERKNLQRNAFIIGFVLVLALAFFVFRSYIQKKKANVQLEDKNVQIEKQKKLVEEKNSKITDSITYAKRIQQATLPSDVSIKKAFPDSFILFLPKDIVSGDFYWYSHLSGNHQQAQPNNLLAPQSGSHLLVAADCTGHGVPGAFMSMIGNTLLNEIVNVKKIYEPAIILKELNKNVISLLHQGDTASETQDDGMDISLLKIDHQARELEFAAANHFCYLLADGKVKQLKGDIYSIGGMFGSASIQFSSSKMKLEKGSTIYLCTDGFLDQFGGEKNIKYTSARFETFLLSICDKKMEEQKVALQQELEKWIGANKQLDDILVVGVRF